MPSPLGQVRAAASALGLHVTDLALEQFDRYLREITDWRRRFNLTAARDAAQITGLHFVDSLLALSACEFPEGCSVADVGSGAGFPGIPLKIVRPDLKLTLVESSRRRVAFLEHVRSVLGLDDMEIEWVRAEEFGHRPDRREAHDRSVERATARLAVAVELCLPLVRHGGAAVLLKGPRVVNELGPALPLVAALGGRVVGSDIRPLPGTDRRRAVIVVGKIAPSAPRFPRSVSHLGRQP